MSCRHSQAAVFRFPSQNVELFLYSAQTHTLKQTCNTGLTKHLISKNISPAYKNILLDETLKTLSKHETVKHRSTNQAPCFSHSCVGSNLTAGTQTLQVFVWMSEVMLPFKDRKYSLYFNTEVKPLSLIFRL